MPDDDWQGMTSEDREKLLRHPGTAARLKQIAQQLADSANSMAAQFNRPSEAGNDNFGVYVTPGGTRARAYVHPLGRTGIHVEQGESVLLKAIAGLPKQ
jgi:hypothetical protein